MSALRPKQLRWVKQVQVPAGAALRAAGNPTTRERLVAALADRPRTVAQLAQAFGLSQPTVLEQVRRALRDGLIVETEVAACERRSMVERYYTPAVPVIRHSDRDLLYAACRATSEDFADALARARADLEAAFAMTTLAREGWTFRDLWPYCHETIDRLALARSPGFGPPRAAPSHGLAWVEEGDSVDLGESLAKVEESGEEEVTA